MFQSDLRIDLRALLLRHHLHIQGINLLLDCGFQIQPLAMEDPAHRLDPVLVIVNRHINVSHPELPPVPQNLSAGFAGAWES